MIVVKSVRVAPSEIQCGDNVAPGFAVLVEPHPIDDFGAWKVAQAIRYALEDLRLDDD